MGTSKLVTWTLVAQAVVVVLCLGVVSDARAQDGEGGGDGGGEAATEGGDEAAAAPSGAIRRSNRMEFDARLIRGERAGSGAVFLFQRAPRALPSMVERRSSYLKDTVRSSLGQGGVKTFTKAKKKAARLEAKKKNKKASSATKTTTSESKP